MLVDNAFSETASNFVSIHGAGNKRFCNFYVCLELSYCYLVKFDTYTPGGGSVQAKVTNKLLFSYS